MMVKSLRFALSGKRQRTRSVYNPAFPVTSMKLTFKTRDPGRSASIETYSVDVKKCIGCGLCLKNCPHDAITGEKKQRIISTGTL
jgi:formate hydrogenlyase subunit 6/NADH:ubiquinone oxidoreductase subunit I